MAQYGLIMPSAPAHFTHPRLQIRTAQDAHRVFEAVRQGILPLIRRRLSPSERELLASGQVFVWEEAPTGSAAGDETSQTTSGLERWTDGRRWSQSRMREPFLFYEEKVQTTAEEKQAKADRRARKASSSDSQAASAAALQPIRRQDRPSKPDGLTKQTYSSYVTLDPSLPSSSPFNQSQKQPSQRKWHCVAYFSAADWNNLPSVDAYVNLRNIVVPDGVYTSTKGTGKSGSSYATDELPNSTPPPPVSSSAGPAAGGGRVGPIRRPMSRGTLSSSPYTSGRPSEGSLGPASPCSASSTSDDPRSPGSLCDSPVSYRPHAHPAHAAYHQQQQQQQAQQQSLHPHSSFPHHHHSSSTSSASTGSPPTPGFMSSIPSPSSFNSTSSSSSSSRTAHAHGRHTDDVIMIDAPTLRTPTKDHPHHHHHHHMHQQQQQHQQQPHRRSGDGKPMMDVEHFATSPTTTTTGTSNSGASLPPFSTILGQSRAAGPAGRSREDSMALGAFRLAL